MNHKHNSLLAFLVGGGGMILFVQHGNTTKKEGEPDAERQLSMKGRFQAERARDYIDVHHAIALVVASNVPRALDTVTDKRWPKPIGVSELYLTPRANPELIEEADVLDAAFKKLQYAPLKSYVDEPGVSTALNAWCDRALDALERIVTETRTNAHTIVVGGHAITLNALCAYLALVTNKQADLSVVMDASLGECDHLQLVVRDGIVYITHFPLQEPPTDEPAA